MKNFMVLVASLSLMLLGLRFLADQVVTPTELFRRLTDANATAGVPPALPSPQLGTLVTDSTSQAFNASTGQGLSWSEQLNEKFSDPEFTASTGSSYGLSFLFYVIVACLYKAKVVNELHDADIAQKERLGADADWKQLGLFACLGNSNTCCYVWFLPTLVAAKNYEKAGVMDFWPACLLLHCTYQFWCVGACVRTYLSGQLKDEFNIKHSFVADCCSNWLCFPCEVGREEIFMNQQLGVEIGCPCKIKYVGGGGFDSGSGFGGSGMQQYGPPGGQYAP